MSAPTWWEAAASHPRPFDSGPAFRADDLVTVRRVARDGVVHTTFGDHGQLSAGRRHRNMRRQAVPHELELLLLRVRAIEEAEGVAGLEVLTTQCVNAQVRVAVDPLDETAAVTNIVVEGLPLFLCVRLGRAVVDLLSAARRASFVDLRVNKRLLVCVEVQVSWARYWLQCKL